MTDKHKLSTHMSSWSARHCHSSRLTGTIWSAHSETTRELNRNYIIDSLVSCILVQLTKSTQYNNMRSKMMSTCSRTRMYILTRTQQNISSLNLFYWVDYVKLKFVDIVKATEVTEYLNSTIKKSALIPLNFLKIKNLYLDNLFTQKEALHSQCLCQVEYNIFITQNKN